MKKNNKIVMIVAAVVFLIAIVAMTAADPTTGTYTIDLFGADIAMMCFFGAWSSNIMLNKGRSPIWGWVAGFFLVYIGVIICAFITKNPDFVKEGEMRCPHCLEVIKQGAVICKHCGQDPRQEPK